MTEVSEKKIEVMGLKEALNIKESTISEREDELQKVREEMEELNIKNGSMRKEVKDVSQRLNSKDEEIKKLQIRIKGLESKNLEKKRKMSNR